MDLQIRARGVELAPPLYSYVERRICFALCRFGSRVRRVLIRLDDLNGPRGGEDQRCKIVVSLSRSDKVTVEANDADMKVAANRAADRIARRVAGQLERRRTLRARGAPRGDGGAVA